MSKASEWAKLHQKRPATTIRYGGSFPSYPNLGADRELTLTVSNSGDLEITRDADLLLIVIDKEAVVAAARWMLETWGEEKILHGEELREWSTRESERLLDDAAKKVVAPLHPPEAGKDGRS